MTERVGAFIRVDGSGLRRVAGMSIVARLVCAMERVGIEKIRLRASPQIAEPTRLALQRDGCSGAGASMELEEEEPAETRESSGERQGELFRLTVDSNVVLDPAFLEALLARVVAEPSSGPLQVGEGLTVKPTGQSGQAATRLAAADLAGTFVEVGSGADARRAKRGLIRACRKPIDIDGLICRLLGRPLSGWISYFLVELPVRPNHVTAVSLLLGLAGAGVALAGGYLPFLVGAALLFFSWVLDNCDGEIARVKYQGSRWGAWFDIYADFVTNIAFVGAMGIGAYRHEGHWVYLLLGGYAVAAMSIYNGVVFRHIHRLGVPDEFLFEWWFDRAKPEPGDETSADKPSLVSRTFAYVKYLGRRDFFIFAYLVAAAFGVLIWALWVTAIGVTYSLVLTFGHLVATRGE